MNTPSDKNFQGQLDKVVQEFSNSESPITLKMLTLEEFSKEILAELMSTPELEEKIDPLIAAIEPTDFSAKRLKLELANLLKRPEIIIDYIQTEEKLLIDRALKFSWIFKAGGSRLSNPKFLVEHLFPKVSYSVRTRIIHRLSKYLNDEKLSDLMFKAIENKYGWSAVLPLIPSCSVEFIRPIMMEGNGTRCKLTDSQLMRIAKKDLKLVIDYLDRKCTNGDGGLDRYFRGKTLKYILQKNPKEFIRIYDIYHEQLSYLIPEQSAKMTKILVEVDRKTVIQTKGKKFFKILNKKEIMKSLTQKEMQDFFVLLLPESLENFKEKINDLLNWVQFYPSNIKLQIVRYAFEKMYSLKLSEHLEYMTPSLVQLLVTEVEEREKIVDWKLQTKDEGRVSFSAWESLPNNRLAFWYSFYGTEKAVEKIKELISIESDVTGRCELLRHLVNICWCNGRDVRALTSVCKYVAARFRNDQSQVKHAFMTTLKDTFNMKKYMDKELFNVYLELIKLMILNDEPDIYDFLEIAVKYCLKNDLPMDSYFVTFIKSKVSRCYNWWNKEWAIAPHDSEVQKRFLHLALDCLSVTYPLEKPLATLESTLTNAVAELVECVTKSNHSSAPGEKMSVTSYPWLMARIMEVLENDCENGNQTRSQKMVMEYLNKDEKARSILYDDLLQSCPFPEVVNHFAWKKPVKLTENLDSVLLFILHQKTIKEYKRFFLRIKAQGFPDLSAKIVEKCLETAEDETVDIVERRNAIQILPLLWETQNCLNLISYFYPPQSKLDITEENYEVLFEMRKAIAMSFSSISLPVAAFQSLIRFCTGDYLKLAVNSLYSICLHSPQSDAIRFLKEELLDRPVSVKKHTIRLVSKIALKEDVPEFLSYLWSENETNVSIREAILIAMFQLLIDEPSKENWNLLKTTAESLSARDKSCLNELVDANNISAIPCEFLSSYLSTCWKVLENIKSEDEQITDRQKTNLLSYFVQHIQHIPREFLDQLVSDNLFNFKGRNADVAMEIASLAAEHLTYYEDSMKTITAAFSKFPLSQISSVEYTASNQYDEYGRDLVIPMNFSRKVTYNFIIELCNKSFIMSDKKQDAKDLIQFFEHTIKKLKEVLDLLKKTIPNAAHIFQEEFLLTLTTVFFEQSKVQTTSASTASKDEKLVFEKKEYLFNIGLKLAKYFDLLVKEWSPSLVELICDNLNIFFEKCYTENLMKQTDIVYLAHGILHCDSKVSLENQLIIAKLLPVPSSKVATGDPKYKELYEYIMNSPQKLVRASLLHRLSKYY